MEQAEEAPEEPPPEDAATPLRRAFAQVPAFQDIGISLVDGVVTLTGAVDSPTARADAESLAHGIPATLWVVNQIELPEVPEEPEAVVDVSPSARDESLAQDLRAIYSQVRAWSEVQVVVEAGVVHLSGTVPNLQSSEEAKELAAGRADVVHVDSALSTETNLAKRVLPSLERMLDSLRALIARIPLLLLGAAVFAGFVWLTRRLMAFDALFKFLFPSALSRDLAKQVARTVLLAVGAFVVLDLIDATALATATLGTAGLVGLAVSFAFRDIFENYLASLILSMRRPFNSRDFVRIGSHTGKVIRMTTSDTVLLTPQGNHLRIPNAKVFKEVLENFTTNPMRRFDFAVGVGVNEDLEHAQELALAALVGTKGVAADPDPVARVENLGDSTVNLRFYGWVDQREADFGKVQSFAIKAVKHRLDEAEIEMPEPIYQVRLQRPMTEAAQEAEHRKSLANKPVPAEEDVAPDTDLDRQIDAEADDQPNLLEDEE